MSHPDSAVTGTVLRPHDFEAHAREAGWMGADVLPVADAGPGPGGRPARSAQQITAFEVFDGVPVGTRRTVHPPGMELKPGRKA
jgi:hypothetical protein